MGNKVSLEVNYKRMLKVVVFLLLVASCFALTACGKDYSKVNLEVSSESYSMVLSDDESENKFSFNVEIDSSEEVALYCGIDNKDILNVSLSKINAFKYIVNCKAIAIGTAKIKLFIGEDQSVYKEVTINIVQPVTSISIDEDFEYYAKLGEVTSLDLDSNLKVLPENADRGTLKYKIIVNSSDINVSLSSGGVLDATKANFGGEITVRVFKEEKDGEEEQVYSDFIVNIISPVSLNDVSIGYRYTNIANNITLYDKGVQTTSGFELIKTGSNGSSAKYLDDYNSATIYLAGEIDAYFSDYSIYYMVEGYSVSGVFSSSSWIKLTEKNFEIKALQLGTSVIKLKINNKGAEQFFDDVVVNFDVTVIDAPTQITISDPASDKSTTLSYDSASNSYDCKIYNSYAEGVFGQSLLLSTIPSSVAESNSTLIIDISKTKNSLRFLNSYGIPIEAEDDKIEIKSNQIIYVNSCVSDATYDPVYTVEICTKFSQMYATDESEYIKTSINFSIYQGITSFSLRDTKYDFYLDLDKDSSNNSRDIEIVAGGTNVDKTGIYYEETNTGIVEVRQTGELQYKLIALTEGFESITFRSGNGFYFVITITTYYRIDSIKVEVDSPLDNGYIGQIEYTTDLLNIATVYAQVGGQFKYKLIINEGNKATLSSSIVATSSNMGVASISTVTEQITVKNESINSEGVKIQFYVLGYTQDGPQTIDMSRPNASFSLICYVPVQTIEISSTAITLKDPSTVSYSKITSYSQTSISVDVKPANATINLNDVLWSIDDASVISFSGIKTSGRQVSISANTIKNSSVSSMSATVTATISVFNKTYEVECKVTVEKAIKVKQVYLDIPYMQLNFDSRKGLGSSSSNYYTITPRIEPSNAFDKKLVYTVVSGEDVFEFNENENRVYPKNGGTGVLRVAPQDCFVSSIECDESLCRYITIVVEDGKTKETAFGISSESELSAIGKSEESLSSYYKLVNNIKLSKAWTPIGTETNPFTGYITGKNTIYSIKYEDGKAVYDENGNVETVVSEEKQYSVENLYFGSLDSSIIYVGLFGRSKNAQFDNIHIELAEDFSLLLNSKREKNVSCFGALVAYATADITPEEITTISNGTTKEELRLEQKSIYNCSVSGSLEITTGVKNSANIGALVGKLENMAIINENTIMANIDKFVVNVSNVEDISNAITNIGGVVGEVVVPLNSINNSTCYLFSTSIVGASLMALSGYDEESETNVVFTTEKSHKEYDVYIGKFSVKDKESTSSTNKTKVYVGGVVGYSHNGSTNKEKVDEIVSASGFNNLSSGSIVGLSVYANISVESTTSYSGLISGYNEVNIGDLYAEGTVSSKTYAGGVAGYSNKLIDFARVYLSNNENAISSACAGGIVGNADGSNANIKLCYVSASKDNKVNINGTVCGVMAGEANNVTILGSYCDALASSGGVVGSSTNVTFENGFAINSKLENVTSKNSYCVYVDNDNTVICVYDSDGKNVNSNNVPLTLSSLSLTKTNNLSFVYPKDINSVYANINDGRPIIAYTKDEITYYIYNVVYDSCEVEIKKGENFIVTDVTKENEKEQLVMFYYTLDTNYAQGLTENQKTIALNLLEKKNCYALDDILTLSVVPKPFSNVVMIVQCLEMTQDVQSSIAYIDENNNIILTGTGQFRLVIAGKLNPNVKYEIVVNSTLFISKFGLYVSNIKDSLEYNSSLGLEFRKATKKDVYAIYHYILSSDIGDLQLQSATNIGVEIYEDIKDKTIETFEQTGDLNYVISIDDKGNAEIKKLESNSASSSDSENPLSLNILGAKYFTGLKVNDEASVTYNFEIELDGVVIKGTANSINGSISWEKTDNVTVATDGKITIKKDNSEVVYYPVNIRDTNNELIYSNFANALYVSVKEESVTTTGESGTKTEKTYSLVNAYATLISKSSTITDTSIISATKEDVAKSKIITKPFIILSNDKILYLNVGNANQKGIEYNVYEGAKSITSNISTIEYSPSDAVNLQLYLISDSKDDDLVYVENEENKDLIIEKFEKKNVEDMGNGNYKYTFDVTILMSNTFEARNITNSRTYNLTFMAKTINDVSITLPLTFVPQIVQRLDVVAYDKLDMVQDVQTNNKVGCVLDGTTKPSSYITPMTSGLLMIDMYPYYGDADLIAVSSNTISGYNIEFDQLYAYEDSTVSESNNQSFILATNSATYDDAGKTIYLRKATSVNSFGEITYNGRMYLRTFVQSGVPSKEVFTIYVRILKYDSNTDSYITKLESTINLEVTTTPKGELINDKNVYSYTDEKGNEQNFVVAGTLVNITSEISDFDLLIGEPTLNLGCDYNAENALQKVYLISTTSEEKDSKLIYNYEIYIGPDISECSTITAKLSWDFESEGERKSSETSKIFTVVKYTIKKINLSSPFSSNFDYVTFNAYASNNIKVESVELNGMIDQVGSVPKNIANSNSELFNYLATYGAIIYDNTTYPITYKNGKFQVNGKDLDVDENEGIGYFSNSSIADALLGKDPQDDFSYTYKMGQQTLKVLYKDYLNNNYFSSASGENFSFLTYKTGENGEFSTISSVPSLGLYYNWLDGEDGGIKLISTRIGNEDVIKISYDYTLGNDKNKTNDENKTILTTLNYSREFKVTTVYIADLDKPQEIESQTAFENMESGVNYILMTDLVLTNYNPINASFTSFDGNGKTITIGSFSEEIIESASPTIALFNNVESETVIKNLTVNYCKISSLNFRNASALSVGLFAISNAGIITNCVVTAKPSDSSSLGGKISVPEKIAGATIKQYEQTTSITITTNSSMTSVADISAFVVSNSGSITHSRVLANNTENINNGETYGLKIQASGKLSGFVIKNSGAISSCYSSNLTLINNLGSVQESRTAGFAVTNSGTIVQSYSACDYEDSSNYGVMGYLSSSGIIAGFVYENSNKILDCYSNIPLSSNANIGGFVYSNTKNGTLENCYSACLINGNSSTHMPFIGVDDLTNILNENATGITNCYYLSPNSGDYIVDSEYPATEISLSKVGKDVSFGGFSFGSEPPTNGVTLSSSSENTKEPTDESVWYHPQNKVPTLYSANINAVSIREVTIEELSGEKVFNYKKNYELGSKYNPITIANAKDFNNYVKTTVGQGTKTLENKYFRIVSDIDFNEVNGEIITTEIGLINCSIEGNGFTLKNVVLKSLSSSDNSTDIDTLGLFAYIKDSNIRNLNIEIIQANCENVKILGGLAGVVIDSNIASVSVTSLSVMSARYVAGGLAGAVLGKSSLENIKASVSININYKQSIQTSSPNRYISGTLTGMLDKNAKLEGIDKISAISYAGGVVGIADLSLVDSDLDSTDIASAYEARMVEGGETLYSLNVSGKITLSAQYVGGVIGFLGSYSHLGNGVYELEKSDSEDQYLESEYCIGGIVAQNYGMISRSAVKYDDQYVDMIEDSIYSYLTTGTDSRQIKKNLFKGNISIAGGIVGVNYFGSLVDCYSVCDVVDSTPNKSISEVYLGGIVGWAYNGYYSRMYTTADVYSSNSNAYLGGVFGRYETTVTTSTNFMPEPKVDEAFALNLWSENSIKLLNDKSSRIGYIIGYLGATTKASDRTFTFSSIADLTIAEKNQLESDLNAIGVMRDTLNDINAISITRNDTFKYYQLYNDEATSKVGTFLDPIKKVTDSWLYSYGELPRLKISAISMEIEVSNLFEFLGAMYKYSYKTIIVKENIDFDITHYSIDNYNYILYNKQKLLVPGTTNKYYYYDSGKITEDSESGAEVLANTNGITFDSKNGNTLNIRNFIKGTYTGKLQGFKSDDDANKANKKLFNITLPSSVNGFFSETRKSAISNLDFHFKALLSTTNTSSLGLITIKDYSSSFTNVNVTFNDLTGMKNLKFGAFVAESSGTAVFKDCSVTGNVTIGDNTTSNASRYYGGYVASGEVVAISNCLSKVNFTIEDKAKTQSTTYVGGFVGSIKSLSVTAQGKTQKVVIKASLDDSTTGSLIYAGLIAGVVTESGIISNINLEQGSESLTITGYPAVEAGLICGEAKSTNFNQIHLGEIDSRIKSNVTIKNSSTTSATANDKLYYGNVCGNSTDCSFSGVYSYVDSTIKIESKLAGTSNVYIGGIVGSTSCSFESSSNSIYVGGTINVEIPEEQKTNIGGVIGYNQCNLGGSSSAILTFDNVQVYEDIILTGKKKNYETYLGGFLGGTNAVINGKTTYSGQISLTNSFIGGVLSVADSTEVKGAIGGIAGQYYGKIENVVVATSIFPGNNLGYAKVNDGTSFDIGSLFGSVNSKNILDISQAYIVEDIVGSYSSTNESSYNVMTSKIANITILSYSEWLERNTKDEENLNFVKLNTTLLGNCDNILQPNNSLTKYTENKNRYTLLMENQTITNSLSNESESFHIVALNSQKVTISSSPLFNMISNKTIVSNAVLELNGATSYALAKINNGIILGVYSYGTTANAGTLLDNNNGVLYDVMSDVNVTFLQEKTNYAIISNSSAYAYVSNVQILGNITVGNGDKSESGNIYAINGSNSDGKNSYAENLTIATNISAKSYTFSAVCGGVLKNAWYDNASTVMSSNATKGSLNSLVTYNNGDEKNNYSTITDITSIYSKNYKYTFVDFRMKSVKAQYNNASDFNSNELDNNKANLYNAEQYNHGYAYLSRFKTNVERRANCDIMNIQNFSNLYYVVNNLYNKDDYNVITLQNTINRRQNGITYFNLTGFKDKVTINGNEKSLINFGLNAKNYKYGFIGDSSGISNYKINNLTIVFGKLNSDSISDFGGVLSCKANNVELTIVTIKNESNNYLYGMAVGGVFGYSSSSTLENVTTENIEVVACDSNGSSQNYSAGIAGGFIAYAKDTTITSCTSNTLVIGGNGKSGRSKDSFCGMDAGVVGGFVAVANGGTIENNTLNNDVITGDAGDATGTACEGGYCYIGGAVGLSGYSATVGSLKVTFESNSTNVANAKSPINASAKLTYKGADVPSKSGRAIARGGGHSGKSYAAGCGGTGSTGTNGKSCTGLHDYGNWGSRYCGNTSEGGMGGTGGNGGKTFIGLAYGMQKGVSFTNNKGEAAFDCAPGGKGGTGGKGGDGESLKINLYFKKIEWWHYARKGGNGGYSGLNGNGNGQVSGNAPSSYTEKSDSMQPGGTGNLSDIYLCYLQS